MKRLLKKFELLLWEDWDPIGVREMDPDWPRDEYDSYAPKLLGMVQAGKPLGEVETYLVSIETEAMGLTPSGRAGGVARKAFEIYGDHK